MRKHFDSQLADLRARSRELKHRVRAEGRLNAEDAATFYSSWLYSGVRLATAVPELQTFDALGARLGIPRAKLRRILEFLVDRGLCVEQKGRYDVGARSTHLPADSPMVARLHANWRLKAIARMEDARGEDLFYTAPVALGRADVVELRKLLVATIERFNATVDPSPCETLACLNLDWFEW